MTRDVGRHAPQPRGQSGPWLFRAINLKREKGDWCCEWLDDLRHKHHILHDLPCFHAIQETDNWTTSAMNVHGYIVYGRDHVKTTPLKTRFRSVNNYKKLAGIHIQVKK